MANNYLTTKEHKGFSLRHTKEWIFFVLLCEVLDVPSWLNTILNCKW